MPAPLPPLVQAALVNGLVDLIRVPTSCRCVVELPDFAASRSPSDAVLEVLREQLARCGPENLVAISHVSDWLKVVLIGSVGAILGFFVGVLTHHLYREYGAAWSSGGGAPEPAGGRALGAGKAHPRALLQRGGGRLARASTSLSEPGESVVNLHSG